MSSEAFTINRRMADMIDKSFGWIIVIASIVGAIVGIVYLFIGREGDRPLTGFGIILILLIAFFVTSHIRNGTKDRWM